ncbi:hypothetical protein PUNSTDRAFT_137557 [Punctularia strigosozonata HHB-11173 SS5]|uniref:uncharacterized protein n=1 Tax=Punctularia strigosozonata (strain HHB-11173) TaxID=741275 RepID=UPI0004417C90|nr:uncharacterized protein PUNSTDRAFT_137557 [Punctularia strigosozonata HHB-11173 SS5]EIN05443.1 hypothetical protein PUNSTDRAFT_137557 [Punctularia strigosozonata HHB-11173 SS5]
MSSSTTLPSPPFRYLPDRDTFVTKALTDASRVSARIGTGDPSQGMWIMDLAARIAFLAMDAQCAGLKARIMAETAAEDVKNLPELQAWSRGSYAGKTTNELAPVLKLAHQLLKDNDQGGLSWSSYLGGPGIPVDTPVTIQEPSGESSRLPPAGAVRIPPMSFDLASLAPTPSGPSAQAKNIR